MPEVLVFDNWLSFSNVEGSSQDNLAHRFVDMIMASSQLENYKQRLNDNEES